MTWRISGPRRNVPRETADADHRLAASSVGPVTPSLCPPCVLASRRRRLPVSRATFRRDPLATLEQPGQPAARRRRRWRPGRELGAAENRRGHLLAPPRHVLPVAGLLDLVADPGRAAARVVRVGGDAVHPAGVDHLAREAFD